MSGGRQGAPGFDPARLRAARERAEMTQAALADAVGAHPNELVEWENGRRVPMAPRVARLARVLDVSPLDLLDLDEDAELTLQHLRVAAGLSQQDAAARSGLTRTTYSMLERGEILTLSTGDAAAIAGAFGTTTDAVRAAYAVGRARLHATRAPANGRRRGARSE